MYDIFYVSKNKVDEDSWNNFKKQYPIAQKLENIKTFNQIKSKAFTKMFWVVWDDLILADFDLLTYRATKWDDMYVHVFKNGEQYDGICLFPKSLNISQKEFDNRFYINKKEIDTVASYPKKYKIYKINDYTEYLKIDDDMFWLVWPEIEVIDETVFDMYVTHHNSYDRKENHVFKNLCNDKETYLCGVVLFSKDKKISQREFARRYLIDKKEHDIVVSRYRYPRYILNNYEEYLEITKNEIQPMFWGIWPEIEITDTTIFDFYFDPNDGQYDYDRSENHAFGHIFKNQPTYSNGVVLFSTKKIINRREFEHRFLIQKKEHERIVSKLKPYDIVFISYNEPTADDNYANLLKRFPTAKRVHGIKGIHQAHIAAASIAETEMFWVVDGDAIIVDEFNFDYEVSTYEKNIVHVWRSKNPINDLIYGYGGVKLLPRTMTLEMNINSADMTTSISDFFKSVDQISNITAFNTDEFSTWRSAFRECVKLSSGAINRQNDKETEDRLNAWLAFYPNKPFAAEAADGARAGSEYGKENKGNLDALRKINDFEWLREKFNGRQRTN